ncbi:DsrE family protein [Bacteroidota bacterium]
MKKVILILLAFMLTGLNSVTLIASNPSENMETNEMNKEEPDNQLLIVWTSGDPDVAHKMVFMYAYNAQKNGWWDQVTLLVWGPSAKLSSEDTNIQESLQKMKEQGVELLACKGCADQYGVSDKLEEIGITVKYTGTYLTDYIKSGKKLISF